MTGPALSGPASGCNCYLAGVTKALAQIAVSNHASVRP